MSNTVLGMFYYADSLVSAARSLKGSGYGVTIHSCVPLDHEIEAEFGERKSYLKYFTLFGAIYGTFAGIVFVLGTAALYALPRGGRPIFSIPPTLLIAYETTILMGVLCTLLGFLILGGVLVFRRQLDPPEINTTDGFGLVVEDVSDEKYEDIEKILKAYGAQEVKTVDEW